MQSNDNSNLVATAIDHGVGELVLSFAMDATGSAESTIRATDEGGLYTETNFTVTVEQSTLRQDTIDGDSAVTGRTFTISFTIDGQTYTTGDLVFNDFPLNWAAAINGAAGRTVVYDPHEQGPPNADVTFHWSTASTPSEVTLDCSNLIGGTYTIHETLPPPNQAPTATEIGDVTVQVNTQDYQIALGDWFHDADDDALVYWIEGIDYLTSPAILDSASIADGMLSLDFAAGSIGTATIWVGAQDPDEQSVVASLTVNVTAPVAPSGLQATWISDSYVYLSWTHPGVEGTFYQVEQYVGDGAWELAGDSTDTHCTVYCDLDSGSDVAWYRVRASSAGYDSAYSTTVPAEELGAPANLCAESIPGSGVRLTWTAAHGATHYSVYRQTSSGTWQSMGGTSSTSCLVTPETFDVSHVFAVMSTTEGATSEMATTDPVLALSAAGDYDHDGLTNLAEHNCGTNPLYFDSDGDLLPDGWETSYGLDALASDQDEDGQPDTQGDPDGDGLTNLAEYNQGTNPTVTDTDNDGASDALEAQQGSDPTSAADGGQPWPDDMRGQFTLTVGDPSWSESERWALHVGDVTQTASSFGAVEAHDYFFQAGESYEISLDHMGTDLDFLDVNGEPDYDWYADIAAASGTNLPYFVVDENTPLYLVGPYQGDGMSEVGNGKAAYEGKTATLVIPLLDADVDSNNDGGYTAPSDNLEEDRLEQDDTTGKIVCVTSGDLDGDGVPDTEDYQIDGGHFVPLVVRLSENVNAAEPSEISVKLAYNGGFGSVFRVWTKDADAQRSELDILEPSGFGSTTYYDLGLEPGGSVTLYIEAMQASPCAMPVTVATQVTGSKWSGTLSDTVHVIAREVLVGVTGDTDALEGSSSDVISFRMTRAQGSLSGELKVQFQIQWSGSTESGLAPSDFLYYDPENPLSIFVQGNVSLVDPADPAGAIYEVVIAAGQQFSDVIVLKPAADAVTGEQFLERATLIVRPVSGQYRVVSGQADVKKKDPLDAYERVTLQVLEGVTRFGTPENSPTSHAVSELVSIDDIRQGGLGDCSFMAALMALANDNPQWVADHTTETVDGEGNKVFTVQLHGWLGWYSYTFNAGTDNILSAGFQQAQLPTNYNYHSDDDEISDDGVEIWTLLYEKAWAQFNSGVATNPASAWSALTGQAAQTISTAGMTDDQIYQTIAGALGQGKQVCLGTFETLPSEVTSHYVSDERPVGNHAYLATTIREDHKVVLRNPWGLQDPALDADDLTELIDKIYILDSTRT